MKRYILCILVIIMILPLCGCLGGKGIETTEGDLVSSSTPVPSSQEPTIIPNDIDRDDDGTPDVFDYCPDVPGDLSNHGCPTTIPPSTSIARTTVPPTTIPQQYSKPSIDVYYEEDVYHSNEDFEDHVEMRNVVHNKEVYVKIIYYLYNPNGYNIYSNEEPHYVHEYDITEPVILSINNNLNQSHIAGTYTLWVEVTDLISGKMAVGSTTFNFVAETSVVKVIISNVHYDADGNDNQNKNDEYVVIKNVGSTDVNLSGWKIKDEGNIHIYTFYNVTLSPNQTLTLYTGCGTSTSTIKYWCESSAVWNNDGDTVSLYDDKGILIDSYSW